MNRQRQPAANASPYEILARRQVLEIDNQVFDERLDSGVARCRRRTGRLLDDLLEVDRLEQRTNRRFERSLLPCRRAGGHSHCAHAQEHRHDWSYKELARKFAVDQHTSVLREFMVTRSRHPFAEIASRRRAADPRAPATSPPSV